MSDNLIALVPEDPRFVPDAAHQARARDRFLEIAPEADEIEIKVTKTIEFFDCGANFERVLCPACGKQIPDDWWSVRMDKDYDNGFKLKSYPLPCCKKKRSLD